MALAIGQALEFDIYSSTIFKNTFQFVIILNFWMVTHVFEILKCVNIGASIYLSSYISSWHLF
jgi:hypothetical protein